MSYTYKINFDDFKDLPHFKEMFLALEKSFKFFKIDYFVLGAIAKNTWINIIHKYPKQRVTKDFDIAVYISEKNIFTDLKDHLTTNHPFAISSENAFALIWKEKYTVDIMPFGAIEDAENIVSVNGKGYTTIMVPGFFEVYEHATNIIHIGDRSEFKLCSLNGIVILKLLAWNDRPESRQHDITDIGDIIYYYFDINDEMIWTDYTHLFDLYHDLKQLSCFVIGAEIKKILSNNQSLINKICKIIEAEVLKENDSSIGLIMAKHFDNTIDENTVLFKTILDGLKS